MQILGCIFIMSSLYFTIFLTEDDPRDENDYKSNSDTLGNSFKTLWKLVTLNGQMKYVVLFFLTYPVRIFFLNNNSCSNEFMEILINRLAFL